MNWRVWPETVEGKHSGDVVPVVGDLDELHPPAAPSTGLHVRRKHPPKEVRPGVSRGVGPLRWPRAFQFAVLGEKPQLHRFLGRPRAAGHDLGTHLRSSGQASLIPDPIPDVSRRGRQGGILQALDP